VKFLVGKGDAHTELAPWPSSPFVDPSLERAGDNGDDPTEVA